VRKHFVTRLHFDFETINRNPEAETEVEGSRTTTDEAVKTRSKDGDRARLSFDDRLSAKGL
jgi:hypothetical protein